MKGLVLKDLYSAKKYKKQALMIIVVFVIMAITMKMPGYIGFICLFFGISINLSTFTTDEYYHWDSYALALPVTRKDIVKGKYVMVLLTTGAATCLGAIGGLFTSLIIKTPMLEGMAEGGISALTLLPLLSVIIPLNYKWGAEKARMMLLVVFMVPSLLIFAVSKLAPDVVTLFLENLSIGAVSVTFAAVCIVGFFISYLLSIKIYEKKEI